MLVLLLDGFAVVLFFVGWAVVLASGLRLVGFNVVGTTIADLVGFPVDGFAVEVNGLAVDGAGGLIGDEEAIELVVTIAATRKSR